MSSSALIVYPRLNSHFHFAKFLRMVFCSVYLDQSSKGQQLSAWGPAWIEQQILAAIQVRTSTVDVVCTRDVIEPCYGAVPLWMCVPVCHELMFRPSFKKSIVNPQSKNPVQGSEMPRVLSTNSRSKKKCEKERGASYICCSTVPLWMCMPACHALIFQPSAKKNLCWEASASGTSCSQPSIKKILCKRARCLVYLPPCGEIDRDWGFGAITWPHFK